MNAIFSLFFSCFFLKSFIGLSQGLTFEKGLNDRYSARAEALTVVDGYTYLYLEEPPVVFHSFDSIVKYDSDGTELWRTAIIFGQGQPPSNFEVRNAVAMVEAPDGGVFVLIKARATCDVVGSSCLFQIRKINPDGTYGWESSRKDLNNYCQFSGFTFQEGAGLLVNVSDESSSKVFVYDPDGLLLDSTVVNSNNHLESLASTTIYPVIGCREDSLFSFSENGQLQQEISLGEKIVSQKCWNDSLFVLQPTQLKIYNAALLELGTFSFSGFGEAKCIRKINNTYYIGFLSDNQVYRIRLAANFEIAEVDSFPSDYTIPAFDNSYYPFLLDFSLSHLSIAQSYQLAEQPFSLSVMRSVRLRGFSTETPNSVSLNRTDASPVGIHVTDYIITDPVNNNPPNLVIQGNICVKNTGNTTLTSVRISHLMAGMPPCSAPIIFRNFQNLQILPGDSSWIEFGVIHNLFFFPPTTPGSPIEKNICVFTSNPNELVDLNISNDVVCSLLNFGFVGIDDQIVPSKKKNLLKTVDMYGRDCLPSHNALLFYLFDDGSVEKKVIQE